MPRLTRKKGYTLHTCTVCDYSYKDEETDKLTHNYSSEWSKDEISHWHACTDEGYTDLKGDEADHSYGTGVVTAPTYEAGGYTTYTCVVCGYSYKNNETPSGKETEASKKKMGILPDIDETKGIVTYGLYPQSYVSDGDLLEALGGLTAPESNGWYLYNGEYYAKAVAKPDEGDFVFSDGTKVVKDTSYWFACELIEWKILANNDGTYSLASSLLLDAHNFDENLNNYKDSDIRAWLTEDFFNSAFNLNSSYLLETTVDNSAATTNAADNQYACDNTSDKVYLLSYKDYLNADYGFSSSVEASESRRCAVTDYAIANGCYQYESYASYWTRSPNYLYETGASCVDDEGAIGNNLGSSSNYCVRPAITLKYPLE